jgi:hypothetical protein
MENEKEIIYDVKEKKGLSQDELDILLKKWQEKLEMKDWDLSLKIVEFRRKNGYRQSGDFIADPIKKTATILMTWDPWRGDEEYTLVHELLHVLIYDYDKYSESLILKTCNEDSFEYEEYMDKLEETAHHLTRIILGRSDR